MCDKKRGAGKTSYDIGYRKPPKSTQFKPGTSGNLKGRPKGAKNKVSNERFRNLVLEEGYRKVPVGDHEQRVTMPIMQAGLRSLWLKAAKGNVEAMKFASFLIRDAENDLAAEKAELLEAAIAYKRDGKRVLDHYQRADASPPKMLPHPDHIYKDPRTAEVEIRGPRTEDEVNDWNWFIEVRDTHKDSLVVLNDLLNEETSEREVRAIEQDVRQSEEFLILSCWALSKKWGEPVSDHELDPRLELIVREYLSSNETPPLPNLPQSPEDCAGASDQM